MMDAIVPVADPRARYQRLAATAFDSLPLPAALLEGEALTIVAANPVLCQYLGFSAAELLGRSLADLQDRAHPDVGMREGTVRLRARDGRERVLYQHLSAVADAGTPLLVWTAHPCTPESETQQRDALTGLFSRRAIEQRLRGLLAEGQHGTLIYLEIDTFKLVNDAYGREAGNHLLAQFGQLLQSLLRNGEEAAYLGGDEFALVLDHADPQRAWQAAERIRFQVAMHGFDWRGRSFGVTVSIGLVGFGDAVQDFTALLAAADMACSNAKQRGRNRIEIYHPDDDELQRVRGEQSWGARVLDVLEGNRFALFRQRIVALNGDPRGDHYEVLLRPQAAMGWSAPGEFVAAAERYGLMAQVDRRVIMRTLRMMAQTPEALLPCMSVNLSGSSLVDAGLAAYIARGLEETGVRAERLRFEVTETAAIANMQRAVALVGALREQGCSFALDDFGAGMSSFSYLKALDVDMIKIDGGFVRGVARDAVDAATIQTIARLAELRGLSTVAECVEDQPTLDCLRDLGIDYAQGFHLHRPEPWSLP